MGLGHCHCGRAEGTGAQILIAPLNVHWRADRADYWKDCKNELQARTKTPETKGRQDKWSKEDIEKLYSLDHVPAHEVALILNRSLWAVMHKRRKKARAKWVQK